MCEVEKTMQEREKQQENKEQMQISLKDNKIKYCKHCGKELEWEWKLCPYCGKEMEGFAKNWEEMFSVDSSFLDKHGAIIYESMCISLSKYENLEDYLKDFDIIAGDDDSIATWNMNRKLLDLIMPRIEEQGLAKEDIYLYLDDGMRKKGKKGMIVAREGLYFLFKERTERLKYTDITSLNKSEFGTGIIFNMVYEMSYSWGFMLEKQSQLALILAFIFRMVYQQTGDDRKILLTKRYK